MTRSKSVKAPRRTSSRPPSYRSETGQDDIDLEAQVQASDAVQAPAATNSKISQDDIEAQVEGPDTVQRPASAMLCGPTGSISASTSNHDTHTIQQNSSEQGGTAGPISNPTPPTDQDKHPYLARIYFVRALFCLVEVGACYAVFLGLWARWPWVIENKTLVGVPLLTFGIYWCAELSTVILKLDKLDKRELKQLGGLTHKEWNAVMQILVPFFAAGMALWLYPMLWQGDSGTEGLD
ncbi:hypothetical protein EDD37DRAFT_353244 [Exophiala viscosa]|uniref:uncharacterized protein n=1 Tax=Exophiala viscosa TaxID=2486360 RepID=UPI002195DA57|nr:hypothetical protein EDD37DRAFT_353244 [Exophiala viscosa]